MAWSCDRLSRSRDNWLGQQTSNRHDEQRRYKHYMFGTLAAAHGAADHTVGLMLAVRPVCRSFGVVMLRNGAMIARAARRRVRVPHSSGQRGK